MNQSLLIRSGRVIDPASALDAVRDLLIVSGRIQAIEPPGVIPLPEGAASIPAQGLWVVPGLIDMHVHLRDPGFPQKETIASGLRAAAAGGFTTVAAMANTEPVNDDPRISRYMLERAADAHAAQLVPVSAVTRGLQGKELVDFAAMAHAGARLFSDDGIPIDDELLLIEALREVDRLGMRISLHEEDRGLSVGGAITVGDVAQRLGLVGIPTRAESVRVARDLKLALEAKAPVHIAHVSAAESIDLIRAARSNGARVSCEVTPHHFALDETAVLASGPDAKMNPPLRTREDVQAIEDAIADGTIDVIATDHAPHDPVSKRTDALAGLFGDRPSHLTPLQAEAFAACANGVVGLETSVGLALALVHRGLISPRRMVEMMALNPARLLTLEGGSLIRGSGADITLIDPDLQWQVEPERFHSLSRNTPFAGMRLRGRVVMTVKAGEVVHDSRATRCAGADLE